MPETEDALTVLLAVNLTCSDDYDLGLCFADESTIQEWIDLGLPNNRISIENATILKNTDLWVLLRDPQEKAINWMKNMLKEKKERLVIVNSTLAKSRQVILRAMEQGEKVLVENLQDEMALFAQKLVNGRVFYNNEGTKSIDIEGTDYPLHPDFRLYFLAPQKTSSLPEDFLKSVAIIDFTITESELMDILVSTTLEFDRPDMRQEFQNLSKHMVHNRSKLKSIEHNMLEAINSTDAAGIVETDDIYNTFTEYQKAAHHIKDTNISIQTSQLRIGEIRKLYHEKLASKVAPLFYTLEELSKLNCAYCFSFKWFLELYGIALESAARLQIINERLPVVFKRFIVLLYQRVSRSMSIADQQTFSILLMIRVLEKDGKINDQEVSMLHHGTTLPGTLGLRDVRLKDPVIQGSSQTISRDHSDASSIDVVAGTGNPDNGVATIKSSVKICESDAGTAGRSQVVRSKIKRKLSKALHLISFIREIDEKKPKWIPSKNWSMLLELESLTAFRAVDLTREISRNRDGWEALCKGPFSPFPQCGWVEELSPWHQLLLQRCLNTEGLVERAMTAASEYLAPECGRTRMMNVEEAYEDSNASMPLIFIVSQSEDPVSRLMQLAIQKNRRLMHIPLGKGQGEAAEKLIRGSIGQSRWILLENCHLAGNWIHQLRNIVESLPTMCPHPGFRLWLTTKPNSEIPPSIFKNSLKLAEHPPISLKGSLKWAVDQLPLKEPHPPRAQREDGLLDAGRASAWMSMASSLCCLQAFMMGRHAYRSMGWGRKPSINIMDMEGGLQKIASIQSASKLQYNKREAFVYTIVQCLQGGHLYSELDRRLLSCCTDIVLRQSDSAASEDSMELISYIRDVLDSESLETIREVVSNLETNECEEATLLGLSKSARRMQNKFHAKLLLSNLNRVLCQDHQENSRSWHQKFSKARITILELLEQIPRDVAKGVEGNALESPGSYRGERSPGRTAYEIQDSIKDDLEDPLVAVLQKETRKCQYILDMVNKDLRDALSVINGTGIKTSFTPRIQSVIESAVASAVPEEWSSELGVENKKQALSSWVLKLKTLCEFLRSWMALGPPMIMPIGLISYPEAYLHAVLQIHSSETQTAASLLGFDCEVLSARSEQAQEGGKREANGDSSMATAELEPPPYGCYISGLVLQGACWDFELEALGDGNDNCPCYEMPIIWMKPVEKHLLSRSLSSSDPNAKFCKVVCPVFSRGSIARQSSHSKGFERHDLPIALIPLPCGEEQEMHWILRNVALFACGTPEECLSSTAGDFDA